jgi:nitrite reductase/ring-hydroxylating ferredoxin subunit
MPEAARPIASAPVPPGHDTAQPLCASAELSERGKAVVFDVLLWRTPARAFALRFGGQVVGYLNRCAHVPTELDWQPGEFLDADQRFIICAVHGALYEPATGQCVGGPCVGARLMPLQFSEREGRVYWYPSVDVHAAPIPTSHTPAV